MHTKQTPEALAKNYFLIGQNLQNSDMLEDAARCYQKSIELFPSVNTLMHLAHVFAHLALPDKSVECCEAALELGGETANIRSDLGFYLLEAGNLVEAEINLRRAIELDPNCSLAKYNLASVFEKYGDWFGALEMYRECVDAEPMNPEFLDSYYNLVTLFN